MDKFHPLDICYVELFSLRFLLYTIATDIGCFFKNIYITVLILWFISLKILPSLFISGGKNS